MPVALEHFMSLPRDAAPTYGNSRPLAVPAIILWLATSSKLSRPDALTSPKLIGSDNPAGVTGLPPGSAIFGTDGSFWMVNASGTPVETPSAADVAAVIGDLGDLTALTTTNTSTLVAALNEVDAHADAVKLRADNGLMARTLDSAQVADLTALRSTVAALVVDMAALKGRRNKTNTAPVIADATLNGRYKTTATFAFEINGSLFSKGATDPLWDLSALPSLSAGQYQAVYLYLNSAGTGSVAAGTVAGTANAAIAALPAQDSTKAVIATVVFNPSTNYANALTAQQQAMYLGYAVDYTLTATSPAALVSAASFGISNATTNGKLKLGADVDVRIGGAIYRKPATDNLWDLSGQTATGGGQYRAYWLYLNTSLAPSIAAGTNAANLEAALDALPAQDSSKAVVGVYVAGPNTNFGNALAAQGTIYDGWGSTAF